MREQTLGFSWRTLCYLDHCRDRSWVTLIEGSGAKRRWNQSNVLTRFTGFNKEQPKLQITESKRKFTRSSVPGTRTSLRSTVHGLRETDPVTSDGKFLNAGCKLDRCRVCVYLSLMKMLMLWSESQFLKLYCKVRRREPESDGCPEISDLNGATQMIHT